METVLVVGASGNIGVSVIIAALRSGRRVLAIVRNSAAEQKIVQHVGTKDGITFVEAQVTDESSVQKVVDRVKAGELPDFQHVYSAGEYRNQFPQYPLVYPSNLPMRQGSRQDGDHTSHTKSSNVCLPRYHEDQFGGKFS